MHQRAPEMPFEVEDVPPERWPNTPIRVPLNRFTGRPDGDDEGFRDVPTIVTAKPEPLVCIDGDIFTTPDLDGINIYGRPDAKLKMKGGLEGGGILLRETSARILLAVNRQIRRVFGNEFELAPTDGYRSAVRQQSIYKSRFFISAQDLKVNVSNMTDEALLQHGLFTDANASFVLPRKDARYEELLASLMGDITFLPGMQGPGRMKSVEDYMAISANMGIGRAKHVSVETNATTAHAGGGAIDMNIWGNSPINGKRVPLVHTAPEFAHYMCGTMFLERDTNFDVFKQLWKTETKVALHMKELGYDSPDQFTFERDWTMFRTAHRIRHHAFVNMNVGGSFYSMDSDSAVGSKDPDENWHYQTGNIAQVEGVVYASRQSAREHPGSGNTCHTKLRLPAGGKAVWGAQDAFEYVEKHFGHEAA